MRIGVKSFKIAYINYKKENAVNRRDIIIISVLINAGVLIVLFASAIKSSPGAEFVAIPESPAQEMVDVAFKKETPPPAVDEVDQALHQYSQNALAAASPVQTQEQQAPAPSSFAEDLKLITKPEEAPAAPAPQKPFVQTLIAPIAPQAKTAPDFTEIKVKKGDVLEKIARHHHTTVAEVMKVNKLTTTNLRIGQVLKIPNKTINKAETSAISFSAPPAASQTSEAGAKYYTVKKGDSPWTIAVKNHIKVENLLKLNNMSEEQARRLKPGDQLRIQ